MTKVRIIDLDTRWVQHVTEILVKAHHEVVGIGGDVALVSDLYTGSVPEGVPFAVFTGHFNEAIELKCYRAGALNFKPKDYEDSAAIVEVVNELIRLKGLVPA